jgi:predicted lipid-binding transport protein (Tim44 family)
MKSLLSIVALLMGFAVVAVDADAARLGGGRSFGRQSSGITRSAPIQRQAPPQAAPTPPAQQPGMSRWLGPLAGLAAGIGLASLFGNSGMGAAMGSIVMLMLLVGAAILIFRLLSRGSAPRPDYYAPAGRTPQPVPQPAPFTGNAGGAAAPGSLAATVGGTPAYGQNFNAAPAQPWPADFNAAEFERQAMVNFGRLQAANDNGDMSTLRDFLTPALYSEMEAEMKSAWGTPQKTEPVDVTAQVVDVVTENGIYVVSVQFSGQIRENGLLSPLHEIWHLEKPVDGRSGWRVAGIQQVS